MTEAEWLVASDLPKRLQPFHGSGTSRKAMLYVCAGLRTFWDMLYDDRMRRGVEVKERIADGLASEEEVWEMERDLENEIEDNPYQPKDARDIYGDDEIGQRTIRRLIDAGAFTEEDYREGRVLAWADHPELLEAVRQISYRSGIDISGNWLSDDIHGWIRKASGWPPSLFDEIFPNPFRPATVTPAWLTTEVTSLANASYQERTLPSGHLAPDRLAVLSDALEEAGATGEILDHLRSPGPHVRGCWALDLILGLS